MLTERYVIIGDGRSHIYWDYLIPDDGAGNPYFKRPIKYRGKGGNSQRRNEGDEILFARAERDDPNRQHAIRPTPPKGSTLILRKAKKSENYFWFLEITWGDTPTGLVLVDNGDGTFKRVAFFRMGRNNYKYDESSPEVFYSGKRDWSWDDGLRMCTVTIT